MEDESGSVATTERLQDPIGIIRQCCRLCLRAKSKKCKNLSRTINKWVTKANSVGYKFQFVYECSVFRKTKQSASEALDDVETIRQSVRELLADIATIRPPRRKAANRRKEFKYETYINSSKWRAVRLRIYEKRGKCCEICNASHGIFHVHHLHYGTLGMEADEDLQVLCKKCHWKEHEKRPKESF